MTFIDCWLSLEEITYYLCISLSPPKRIHTYFLLNTVLPHTCSIGLQTNPKKPCVFGVKHFKILSMAKSLKCDASARGAFKWKSKWHTAAHCYKWLNPKTKAFVSNEQWVNTPEIRIPGLTSSVLIAKVGETPDIPQANNFSSHWKNKLNLVAPLTPVCHFLLCTGHDVQWPAVPIGRLYLGHVVHVFCGPCELYRKEGKKTTWNCKEEMR